MAQRWYGPLWSRKRDRRRGPRVARYFDCKWLGPWGEDRARVRRLSLNGCYIESRFSVPPDGVVIRELRIALPTGTVNLEGTVVDATSGIGFGVRFSELDTTTRQRLN